MITLELQTPPGDDRPVYLTGNFNDWQAGDDRYHLQAVGPGNYRLRLATDTLPADMEYKYLRKDWGGVEVDDYGNERPNRRLSPHQDTATDKVPRWKREGLSHRPELLPRIEVISEHFEIPQLIRTRRISVLLPHDYYHTDKHYPVLYLQDGQNLFDDYAPFGNWALDKKLAVLSERGTGDLIIIAIDHAAEQRIAEFTPSFQTRLGRGEGKKYVRFLTDTLKPFVDKNFRTLPSREHTGIGGSSMGGLISIYAGLMYPEAYGKLMIFSPSLWVSPNIPFNVMDLSEPFEGRIYLYGGAAESTSMVPNMERFRAALTDRHEQSRLAFHLAIDPQGMHNEARWGEEFPRAVEWLYYPNDRT